MGLLSKLFNQTSTASLEERISKLEREWKGLQMEWELAYDKLHSMMGRIARRAEKQHEKAEAEGKLYSEPLPASEADEIASPLWNRLSPRQKAIQQQVLSRRRQNGGSTQ